MTETTETETTDTAAVDAEGAAETKAKSMGWVPQDEFRGDKSRWVDADKFIEIGESKMPVMRERNEALHGQIQEMKASVEELKQHFKQQLELTEKQARDKYGKAIAELKSKQRQAVQEGDTDEYDRIEREIATSRPPEPAKPVQNPVFDSWLHDNSWYQADSDMRRYADYVGADLASKRPGMTHQEILAEATREVKTRFPEKFGNPNRQQPSDVFSGSDSPPAAKGKRSFADLPQDAKAACNKFVKQGWLTKDEYLATYNWE